MHFSGDGRLSQIELKNKQTPQPNVPMNFLRNVFIYVEIYIRPHLLGQLSKHPQSHMTTISILE